MIGKFITLEGPEGSGKTTVSKELVKILNEGEMVNGQGSSNGSPADPA